MSHRLHGVGCGLLGKVVERNWVRGGMLEARWVVWFRAGELLVTAKTLT